MPHDSAAATQEFSMLYHPPVECDIGDGGTLVIEGWGGD